MLIFCCPCLSLLLLTISNNCKHMMSSNLNHRMYILLVPLTAHPNYLFIGATFRLLEFSPEPRETLRQPFRIIFCSFLYLYLYMPRTHITKNSSNATSP